MWQRLALFLQLKAISAPILARFLAAALDPSKFVTLALCYFANAKLGLLWGTASSHLFIVSTLHHTSARLKVS
jgi:hypothetical protein